MNPHLTWLQFLLSLFGRELGADKSYSSQFTKPVVFYSQPGLQYKQYCRNYTQQKYCLLLLYILKVLQMHSFSMVQYTLK